MEKRLPEVKENDINELIRLLKEEEEWYKKKLKYDDINEKIFSVSETVKRIIDNTETECKLIEVRLEDARKLTAYLPDLEREHETLTREFHRLTKIREKQDQITKQGLKDRIELELLQQQIDQLIVTKSDWLIRLDQTQKELTRLREEYLLIENDLKLFPDVEKRLIANEFFIEQAHKAEKDVRILSDEMQKLKHKLTYKTMIRRESGLLDALKTELQSIQYDPQKHFECREALFHLTDRIAQGES
ncbi:MAG TPA: hypothetical protein PLG25_14385 [bacterium]|nr:hypothetical protein [bacterium]HNB10097.1 hypothetical protein [bacterium]HNB57526.1 hypothetical protein [bacterium]HND77175.1 hypothetical protein [bacterium]HNE85057.1 hypothetical protein [bacterium]